MTAERQVRVFRTGKGQAVSVPAEFELPGETAIIRKEGNRLVIEPLAPPLLATLATLQPIEDEFPAIEELPHTAVDL